MPMFSPWPSVALVPAMRSHKLSAEKLFKAFKNMFTLEELSEGNQM